MTTTPAAGPIHDERAARVIAVRVRSTSDRSAVLTVTAQDRNGEVTRTLHAPAATIRHAARSVARFYGLEPDGEDTWRDHGPRPGAGDRSMLTRPERSET